MKRYSPGPDHTPGAISQVWTAKGPSKDPSFTLLSMHVQELPSFDPWSSQERALSALQRTPCLSAYWHTPTRRPLPTSAHTHDDGTSLVYISAAGASTPAMSHGSPFSTLDAFTVTCPSLAASHANTPLGDNPSSAYDVISNFLRRSN